MQKFKQHLIAELLAFELGSLEQIQAISQGLSQQCFVVTFSKNGKQRRCVAKVYNCDDLKNTVELKSYQAFSDNSKFTPKLVGFSEHILLLEYIDVPLLVNHATSHSEKLVVAMQTMQQIHNLPVEKFSFCQPLNLSDVVAELIGQVQVASAIKESLTKKVAHQLAKLEAYLAENKVKEVLCHGDLNFGNIFHNSADDLRGKDELTKVIDFESLTLMPPEYDIAMMLAVNELSLTELANNNFTANLGHYSQELISIYYPIALVINGLWYFAKYQTEPDINTKLYQQKASVQFTLANITDIL